MKLQLLTRLTVLARKSTAMLLLIPNTSCGLTQSSKPTKAKLSDDFVFDDNVFAKSPVLQHKLSSRPRTDQDSQGSEDTDDRGVKTNLFCLKYVVWFEVGI